MGDNRWWLINLLRNTIDETHALLYIIHIVHTYTYTTIDTCIAIYVSTHAHGTYTATHICVLTKSLYDIWHSDNLLICTVAANHLIYQIHLIRYPGYARILFVFVCAYASFQYNYITYCP